MLLFSLKKLTLRKITIDNSMKFIPKMNKQRKEIVNQKQ